MARLDQVLVERGLCDSREKAQRAILAGQVFINDRRAEKASDRVKPDDQLRLATPEKYVSRGGLKLEHALQHFKLDVRGVSAMDVGASTGGFTDCLLQHGAAKVVAIDVGHGQLAWKLRQDSRVVVMEKTNARHLTPASFPQPFTPLDFAVVDCSFISVEKILPAIAPLLRTEAGMVVLIKPQFEAGKHEVDKGEGVITDPRIHEEVLHKVEAFVQNQPGLQWRGVVESPITGPAGNKEFLALLVKTS